MFECVESNFSFNRCLRQGSVEAPRLWQKMATQLLANVEENWTRKKRVGKCGGKLDKEEQGRLFRLGRTKSTSDMQLHVGQQLLDHDQFKRKFRTELDGAGSDWGRTVGLKTSHGSSCGGPRVCRLLASSFPVRRGTRVNLGRLICKDMQARKIWAQMGLSSLYEAIAESTCLAMEWVCAQCGDQHFEKRLQMEKHKSAAGLASKKDERRSCNHRRWKHKWVWHKTWKSLG